jgi:hypothetical protein
VPKSEVKAGNSKDATVNRRAYPCHGSFTPANTEGDIWRHVFRPEKDDFPPEMARYVLNLDFRQSDHKRMEKLSLKAQKGTLTPKEQAELDGYIRVSDLLAIIQSKARRSLKRHE